VHLFRIILLVFFSGAVTSTPLAIDNMICANNLSMANFFIAVVGSFTRHIREVMSCVIVSFVTPEGRSPNV
jgi:hypothetical protein